MNLLLPSALAAMLLTTAVNLPPIAAVTTSDFQSPNSRIAIYNVNYNGQNFTGTILNKTGKVLKLLKLYYKVLDAQGQIIETGSVFILEDELGGKQNGGFSGKTDTAGTSFVVTSAEWI